MGRVIGIDLGTTNTAIAVLDQGRPRVLEDEKGYKVLPSCVSLKQDGKFMVGQAARQVTLTSPDRTVYAVKRLMGRRFDSPEVQAIREKVHYNIEMAPDGGCLVSLGGQLYSPVEISAVILQVARTLAERALGDTVDEAVITVPAYFNHAQRAATFEAARLAGLRCERLLNEPTAAALAYGFRRDVERTLLIFDLGGGTFDVSVLRLTRGVYEILASRGDTFLGGEDIDYRLVDSLANQFEATAGIDVRKDRTALQRLKEAAERGKCELSFTDRTTVLVPHLVANRNLEIPVSRLTLESLVEDLIERTLDITRRAVADAGLKLSDIDEVVLVGGQTRMPRVREAVSGLFQKEPSRSVHPEEAVAVGAAVHASNLVDAEVGAPLLLDVTPFDLGIDVAGGLFQAIITRNSHVPTSHARSFATVHDNQDAVRVVVRQGTSRTSAENEFLGEFVLSGLTPAPSMQTKVEVNFRIDTNGMLHVSAIEPATGESKRITVRNYAQVASGQASHAPDIEGDVVRRVVDSAVADALAAADGNRARLSLPKVRLPGRDAIAGLIGRVRGTKAAPAAPPSAAAVTPTPEERSPGTADPLAPDTLVPDQTFEQLSSGRDTVVPAEPATLADMNLESLTDDAVDGDLDDALMPVAVRDPGPEPASRIILPDVLAPWSATHDEDVMDTPSVLGPASTLAERRPASFGLAGESPSWEYEQGRSSGARPERPLPPAPPKDWDFGLDLPDEGPTAAELGNLDDPYPSLDDFEADFSPKAPGAPGAGPTQSAGARSAPRPSTEAQKLGMVSDYKLFSVSVAETGSTGPDASIDVRRHGQASRDNRGLRGRGMMDPDSVMAAAEEGSVADLGSIGADARLRDLSSGKKVDELLSLAEELFAGLPSGPTAPGGGGAAPTGARWQQGPTTLLGGPPTTPAPPRSAASGPPDDPSNEPIAVRRPAKLKLAYPRLDTFKAEYRENLRRGSCFVKTDRPLPVGRECRIEASAPGLPRALDLYGVVRRVIERPEPGTNLGPGMEIEYRLTPDQRQQLERALSAD